MPLTLIIAFVVILALLAFALLWSDWPRWLKAMLVLGVTGLYFYGHDTALGLLGQPSTAALPEKFVMLAAVVDEPAAKSPGAIYLWVSPILEGQALLQPRAYRLPYTRPLHESVNEGIKKGKDGVKQMGTAKYKTGQGRAASWLNPGNDEQEIKVRDLPVPQLPEK